MHYLVIENLGKVRCIDKHEMNIYKNNQSWDCLKDLDFVPGSITAVGTVTIRCHADPSVQIEATIYSD